MTTPNQILLLEAMLQHLRVMLAREKVWAAGSAENARLMEKCSEKAPQDTQMKQAFADLAVQTADQAHTLEQTIALLEVLKNPYFEGISHYWEACKPQFFSVVLLDTEGGHRGHQGKTVLEAILKAHEAIKATPTPPKGDDAP